ncbi:MAG: hypothetical protein JWR13_256 [Mycobacterium sp.]|jgi:hypothetical protein|nr:hypothetical protein [Mycobacterium sp.]MDT5312653.1 hypothetical protein [Mycobacterium sp.]
MKSCAGRRPICRRPVCRERTLARPAPLVCRWPSALRGASAPTTASSATSPLMRKYVVAQQYYRAPEPGRKAQPLCDEGRLLQPDRGLQHRLSDEAAAGGRCAHERRCPPRRGGWLRLPSDRSRIHDATNRAGGLRICRPPADMGRPSLRDRFHCGWINPRRQVISHTRPDHGARLAPRLRGGARRDAVTTCIDAVSCGSGRCRRLMSL